MESVYSGKKNCCGCGLCEARCPKRAITMKEDAEGFLYPEIDGALCVACGLCVKSCPLLRKDRFKEADEPCFYAATHKSEEVLMRSTSGGAFTALSDVVLRRGGVVYGADFDDELCVVHRAARASEGRDRMRLSKYVQSDIRSVLAAIKEDAARGPALFTGTPCQCAAVRALFDGAEPAELFICDLICHSVPSPLIWEEYKKLLGRERGGKVTAAQFRSKKYEWNRDNSNKGFIYRVEGAQEEFEDERYYRLFVRERLISRPSCGVCPFTDTRRPSDMTIADCWGIEKYAPELCDRRGVSLIMTNTKKGGEMLDAMSKDISIFLRPKEEITAEQQRLSKAVPFPQERAAFWEAFRRFGFDEALKIYGNDR
ncbi:MAG: Coenzyme F420 hydrogenase/dehydrogenase, beta subunit C-terminal domain [Cloacibacillus sp.]